MNTTYFIGRLVHTPEIKEVDNNKKVTNITVAVPRSYKNSNGDYETDFIDCVLWDRNAEKISSMKQGEELAVQGRIETKLYEKDDKKIKEYKVIVDRVKNLEKQKEKSEEKEI